MKLKKRDLEKRLQENDWMFLRHGGNHDVWTDGNRIEPIPRHKEINERLAKAIIRKLEL